jgi:hypothetical protein
MSMMILALLLPAASAAGVAIAPSDGIAPIGPREPAWVVFGHAQAARSDLAERSRELDAAWNDRRALENASARRRVDALISGLRPVLDAGERDLLQRALFLRGVLDIDDAGGIEAVPDAVDVGGQRIPRAWADAIAVSPGAPAPATADAAFAVHVYDQARTVLAQRDGTTIDPSAPGAGEVRVDGLPVTDAIALLPGLHTLSWHPVGADPVVLMVSAGGAAGGMDAEALRIWLVGLTAAQAGDHALSPEVRGQLHAALQAPAALVNTARPPRLVWLVDGAARWGKPTVDVGVTAGAWALASTTAPSVACDGTVEADSQALGVAAIEGGLTAGPLRMRAGLGVDHAFGGGFAAAGEGTCGDGLPNVEMVTTMPYGWVSAGRRFGLSRTREIEAFLRLGGTGAYAVAQLGADYRVRRGDLDFDVRLLAGPAANLWSDGGAQVAFTGGVETAASFGRR